jgi:hypothetical protein
MKIQKESNSKTFNTLAFVRVKASKLKETDKH